MKLAPSSATLNIGSSVSSKIGSPVWLVKSATRTLTAGCTAFDAERDKNFLGNPRAATPMSKTIAPIAVYFQIGLCADRAGTRAWYVVGPAVDGEIPSHASSW